MNHTASLRHELCSELGKTLCNRAFNNSLQSRVIICLWVLGKGDNLLPGWRCVCYIYSIQAKTPGVKLHVPPCSQHASIREYSLLQYDLILSIVPTYISSVYLERTRMWNIAMTEMTNYRQIKIRKMEDYMRKLVVTNINHWIHLLCMGLPVINEVDKN